MIEVLCPTCSERYLVPEEFRTRTAKCRVCGGRIPVPGTPADEPIATPDPATDFEQSPGGSRVYRYESAGRDLELAIGDGESIERIGAHIEEHLGTPESVFHEIVSHLVHIDVHIIAPRPERNFWTLVTTGMSDRPMTPPADAPDETRYAELLLCLPPTWPVGDEALQSVEFFWPIQWLKMLARFPHEYETWLGGGHTIPNGDPAEPFAEGTELCCWMLAPPLLAPPEFHELTLDDGKTIRFFALVPLHRREMEYKLEQGYDALLERLDEGEVSELLRPDRPPVC